MKQFTILSLFVLLLSTTVKADEDQWGAFYSYLAQKIAYPTKARLENHQGNSIITFSITAGSLKNVNVQTELSKGCDVEILNRLMAYPQIKTIKDGKYALKVAFRLQGSNAVIVNEFSKLPVGFTALNTIHIIGYLPDNAQQKSLAPAEKPSIKVRGFGDKALIYVVDGELVSSTDIIGLDQDKIESISILKDASAISLYGPQAKDGVISIITKKSAKTDTSVTTGSDAQLTIRGLNKTGKIPLYIIDGEVAENGLVGLDPNTIQTVEVVKNASAISLYGSKAADGAIIITTKKSAAQKTKK